MTRLSIFLILVLASTIGVLAQITIRSGTEVKVKGQLSTYGFLVNNSDKLDLTEGELSLIGTNQTLSTISPLTSQSLSIDGEGIKTMQGEWIITNNLIFTKGILLPATGKVLYTGNTTLTGNTASFINGPMFQRGAGTRFFPIGSGNAYMPMSLNNVKDAGAEIKAEAFNAGANLSLPEDLSALATNRYWQLSASGGTWDASSASLYVPGSSVDAASALVVVQADDANGATAINLGGGVTNDFVTSFSAINKPVLTIGVAKEVNIQIHDLITPFNADNVNDHLKIVNVEFTFRNKVTLLDRWGVVVKEWIDFRNYDDPANPNSDSFDFSKLGPGNYICILEYQLTADAPEAKLTQMISVLKGN
ncbi:MAG: hypothetical protein RI909_2239 [Bacteroidota bacterium]|jgi:hypothetical protein